MVVPVLSADALPEGTAQAYARMRERFISGLTARWADIVAAEDDAKRQFLLHRMSGAAGSFGCDELGTVAGRAEAAAQASDQPGLAQALDALSAMIDRMVQSNPPMPSPPHKETP